MLVGLCLQEVRFTIHNRIPQEKAKELWSRNWTHSKGLGTPPVSIFFPNRTPASRCARRRAERSGLAKESLTSWWRGVCSPMFWSRVCTSWSARRLCPRTSRGRPPRPRSGSCTRRRRRRPRTARGSPCPQGRPAGRGRRKPCGPDRLPGPERTRAGAPRVLRRRWLCDIAAKTVSSPPAEAPQAARPAVPRVDSGDNGDAHDFSEWTSQATTWALTTSRGPRGAGGRRRQTPKFAQNPELWKSHESRWEKPTWSVGESNRLEWGVGRRRRCAPVRATEVLPELQLRPALRTPRPQTADKLSPLTGTPRLRPRDPNHSVLKQASCAPLLWGNLWRASGEACSGNQRPRAGRRGPWSVACIYRCLPNSTRSLVLEHTGGSRARSAPGFPYSSEGRSCTGRIRKCFLGVIDRPLG